MVSEFRDDPPRASGGALKARLQPPRLPRRRNQPQDRPLLPAETIRGPSRFQAERPATPFRISLRAIRISLRNLYAVEVRCKHTCPILHACRCAPQPEVPLLAASGAITPLLALEESRSKLRYLVAGHAQRNRGINPQLAELPPSSRCQ